MEVGPLVVLGLMWVVLNTLRKGGSRPTGGSGKPPSGRSGSSRPPEGARPRQPASARLPGSAQSPGGGPPLDATQREGSQLEQLLRELGRTLDQGGQQGKRPTIRTLPPARPSAPGKPAKKGESLVPTEARSLEVESGEGAVSDLDDEAERVAEQRIAAAEANQRPLSEADHQAFEARIRQEPADKTATRAYTARQLREAVVWREILGPPVSLRGEREGDGYV
ncbi:MAG TPA: hypothetical protein VJQ46_17880 [Gemmatimonadales bacterium]|nr:hypothetical protein [Gemmatimonadales bacterium]